MHCLYYVLPLIWLWTAYAAWVDWRTQAVPGGWPRLAVYAATALCAAPMQVRRFRLDALFPDALILALVFGGWLLGTVGGGDVKVWAVWWFWTPPDLAWQGALALAAVWVLGSLFAWLVLRWPRGEQHPAAWKAALYGAWLLTTRGIP